MDNQLEIFFSLLDSKSNENIKNLLLNYKNDKEIFMYLWKTIPENLKPNLTDKNNEELVHSLFYAIRDLGEEEFNKFFFSELKDLVNNKWLKRSLYEMKSNVKLQDFLLKEDKPKNKNQLIDKLSFYYFDDKDKYYELIKIHKKDLVFINNIKVENFTEHKKSVILENLFNWLSVVKNRKDMTEVLKIVDELGYDFSDKNISYKHKINYNYACKLSNEDLDVFKILFDRNPDVSKYKLLHSMTTLMESPIYKIETLMEINKKAALFLWDIFEEHLLFSIKDPAVNNSIKIENKDSFEILAEVYIRKPICSFFHINPIINVNNEFCKEFKMKIYQARVDVLESELTKNETSIKRAKI